jgi:hypothetical protein
MKEFNPIAYVKEIGGVLKFGSGVLGKSAIALGILLLAVIVAAARLHSDAAILSVIGLGVIVFLGWFLYVLKFAGEHPDIALLEGGEWSGFQRFQAAAKGYLPEASEKQPTALPGSGSQTALPEKTDDEEDK